jgi:branched-chain amino acid transport system ATP-binding protein
MSKLAVEDLVVAYGAEPVLRDVHFEVEPGEILAVLGPNGAGKTTLFKTIAGLLTQRGGTVRLDGRELGRTSAERRARQGIILVPEGRRLFNELSVLDNLRAGSFTGRDGYEIDRVLEIFPRLGERLDSHGGMLSGGEQQMLALGRALRGGPAVLLVDEPSLGLAPLIVETVFDTFGAMAREGIAVVIAEQNVAAATAVAGRCLILEAGELAFESACRTPEEIEAVNAAYASVIKIGTAAA